MTSFPGSSAQVSARSVSRYPRAPRRIVSRDYTRHFTLGLAGWSMEGLDDTDRARALDDLRTTDNDVKRFTESVGAWPMAGVSNCNGDSAVGQISTCASGSRRG